MKRILIALAVSTALTGGAYAGDLNHRGSLKDPVERQGRLPEPEVQQERGVNWTGFYIGGHAGWGVTTGTATTVDTQHFNATPSKCWARGSWTSTNSPTTDPANFHTLSNDFDLNFSPDTPSGTDVDLQLPAYGATDVDPDGRVHTVNAGASVTDITEEECADIRQDLTLINSAGVDQYPNITSGYDPAVAAHDVVTTTRENFHDSGFEGGVRLGADLARGGFLGGVFGEYNWSAVEEHNGDWLIAGRAGAIVGGRTMIYGLVGYAQADFGDIDFGGVAVGGGIEYALTKNLFINGEYVHTFYDDEKVGNTTIELDSDKVRAGLKYKIGTDEAPF